MKGMSAVVAIVLSLVVIILLLAGTFGPASITKNLNKMFFGEEAELIPKYDDTVVPGTVVGPGVPKITITGETKPEIAQQIANQLTSCWKRMQESRDVRRCEQICICTTPSCNCATLREYVVHTTPPTITLGFILQKLNAPLKDQNERNTRVAVAESLAKNWNQVVHFAVTTPSPTEITNEGLFENVVYEVCAKHVLGGQDLLFVTDSPTFKCE